jgi:hypothetical protein
MVDSDTYLPFVVTSEKKRCSKNRERNRRGYGRLKLSLMETWMALPDSKMETWNVEGANE